MQLISALLFLFTLLSFFPVDILAQSVDTTFQESSIERGHLALFMTGVINVANLTTLNAFLADNGYSEFEEIAMNPLRSFGLDMLVYSGFEGSITAVSFRLLSGGNWSADYDGLSVFFGPLWNVPLSQRVRFSFGGGAEISMVKATARRANQDSLGGINQGELLQEQFTLSQIALGPQVNLDWSVMTFKRNGDKPGGSLDVGLKLQYNFPIGSSIDAYDPFFPVLSFNFSQMMAGIKLGYRIEL